MDVAVTTVVTDKAGKTRRNSKSTVRMLFHGYNLQAGKFSLNVRSGWFNTGALRDSISGDMAAFWAPVWLMPDKEGVRNFEVREPAQPGQPALVVNHEKECSTLELMPGKYLFPRHPCGAQQMTVAVKPPSGLIFQKYSLDCAGLPASAEVPYLGVVQLLALHFDVEFTEGFLPGDSKPFLWPKQTFTSATTDKGKISITNQYRPRVQVGR
jgi:hypothetical protein